MISISTVAGDVVLTSSVRLKVDVPVADGITATTALHAKTTATFSSSAANHWPYSASKSRLTAVGINGLLPVVLSPLPGSVQTAKSSGLHNRNPRF